MASWSISPNDTASINANGKATFQPNTSNTPREYTVTYTSDNDTVCTMTVTQQGNVCSFKYSESEGNIPLTGKTGYVFGTLSNIDGQTITVSLKSTSRQYIDGELTVNSSNEVVGNVKTNDNGQANIDPRYIEYSILANGAECASYSKKQEGKTCTCECTDLSVSENSLSWLYNEGATVNKKFKITPGCTTDVTIDKSGAGWFTVSDMDSEGYVTVHPQGENDTQSTKSGHVVIKFKACGKSCDAQFEKTIEFTQGINSCSCTVFHYTPDTSVIPGERSSDLYKIGSFTLDDSNCDYKLFDLEITSDPRGIVVGRNCEIDQSSPHGVWVHINPNLPTYLDSANLSFNYKAKFNGENCATGTKQMSYCNCRNTTFNYTAESRYDLGADNVTVGILNGTPECAGNIVFFSYDTNVIRNFTKEAVQGQQNKWYIKADLPQVEKATATTFGYKFDTDEGVICNDKYKIVRACLCPTDNCCIYDDVEGVWVYYHPMHVDAAYYNLNGQIVDSGYVASPRTGDSVLLPNNTVEVQPGLIYNGDIQRGGDIGWYCPSDMSCSGDGKYPKKTGNWETVHGGPLYNDDLFTITNGDMTVTVRYSDGYWSEGTYHCPFLNYWVNTNNTSSSRDTEIIFNVHHGTQLNTDCLDPDDYKNHKYSCDVFKVIIRQASNKKKYIRKCINSYTHESNWIEVPYYYMCPNTGGRECWELYSVVEGKMVTYTATENNKVTAIDDSTFGSTVVSHTFSNNYDDYSLGEVKLAGNATTVNGSTFAGNNKLTTINLPKTVTSIAANAFANCSKLISVILNSDTPPTLGNNNVFAGNESHRKIYVPASKVTAYKTAWSTYASVIEANPVTYENS